VESSRFQTKHLLTLKNRKLSRQRLGQSLKNKIFPLKLITTFFTVYSSCLQNFKVQGNHNSWILQENLDVWFLYLYKICIFSVWMGNILQYQFSKSFFKELKRFLFAEIGRTLELTKGSSMLGWCWRTFKKKISSREIKLFSKFLSAFCLFINLFSKWNFFELQPSSFQTSYIQTWPWSLQALQALFNIEVIDLRTHFPSLSIYFLI